MAKEAPAICYNLFDLFCSQLVVIVRRNDLAIYLVPATKSISAFVGFMKLQPVILLLEITPNP